jgi:hypothetical protein
MQILEVELRVQNRTLKQVKREGMVALYELHGANGLLYGYEVILVRVLPAQEIMGRQYPEREAFPANESWGKEGWSYGVSQKQDAKRCFEQLCRKHVDCALMQTDLVT